MWRGRGQGRAWLGDVRRFLEDGLGEVDERPLDVHVRLGRSLEEWDSVLAGDGLSPLLADDPLVIHVAFVAQDHLLNVLVGVFLNVPQPLGNVVEALAVGDVVDEHDAHGTPVVARRDCMEPLLSRRVPDLQLDFLPPELDGLDLEVNTDRRDECVVERVVREPEQDACLSHARVTDE